MRLVCSFAALSLSLALAGAPALADDKAAPAAKAADKPAEAERAAKPAPPPPDFGIAGIRAYLYFHASGTIGTQDITDGKAALWNTIIGEGDAGHPSNTTIVFVDLAGPNFSSVTASLEVVIKAGKKTVVKQKFAVGEYFTDPGDKIVLPLVVPGTGCDELTVTATLTVNKKKSKKVATIPFGCGE